MPSRTEHGFTLARLGGDEFTVLLEDITDASDAIRVAERLRRRCSSLSTSTDIRCSCPPPSASRSAPPAIDRPEDVLQDAAIALHRAKANGTTPYELFDPAMRERAVSRLQVETDLRNAIENRSVRRPVPADRVAARRDDRRVRGAGPVAPSRREDWSSPAEFIPIAEEPGMIRQIGRMVLVESCRQMVALAAAIRAGRARASSASTCRAANSRTSIWRATSRRFCRTRAWRRPA